MIKPIKIYELLLKGNVYREEAHFSGFDVDYFLESLIAPVKIKSGWQRLKQYLGSKIRPWFKVQVASNYTGNEWTSQKICIFTQKKG